MSSADMSDSCDCLCGRMNSSFLFPRDIIEHTLDMHEWESMLVKLDGDNEAGELKLR